MKRVIIIHYWEGYPNYCWYPQTKKELGEQGFEVQVPEMPIDFKKVRQHCDKFVVIHSDNDPYVDLKYGEIFREKLGAEVVVLNNKGHFSGPADNAESCTTLSEVTQAILKISNG